MRVTRAGESTGDLSALPDRLDSSCAHYVGTRLRSLGMTRLPLNDHSLRGA